MYRVYCNNSPLYDLRDEDLVLISPIVKIGENTAGSFEFSILPKHPHYEEDNLYESFEIYKKEVHSSPGNAMFPGFFFA